jgi:hypothetical protein
VTDTAEKCNSCNNINNDEMKKLIFSFLTVFIFCSCSSDGDGFDSVSKKEIMDSWAWKIFIFTDLGERASVQDINKDFDNRRKVNPIFVEDVWVIDPEADLFLNSTQLALKDPIVNANTIEGKNKK